ncbi:hypothetical protein BABINDRAFT_171014 [Babjeviella inositovora NRRL Y-12698]|uniref:Chromatin-remodeling ATPase INO80 n=1 Tax=Babjeviella inositovora NRRL Y-12698 TaxID=984486 RepID=A0A1E3QT24_9ASCO|nr:uncharacterized protein BABINDRAFT_171014 [Babjeviella inositovora NRRL Y-12698]ODQ80654.1 hypothetical protein BABINDRAFT_171014 [Babjeviella inositovora NRRL Y-12698]
MREMLNFWKRNEREEKELRKRAEKELVDKAKREEDAREAKRQSRKLNFLITQTELYSHFIGKKIRTDEIENAGEHGPVALTHGLKSGYDIEAPSEAVHTDLHSIDFENEKDEDLVRQAAANAQSALLATQGKARAFNGDAANGARADANGSRTTPDDDDDLNFQNPTSLGDISIEQPKLLSCTLKEYQVKGLNWLANLYDQGINGILADEMGLGKTVQSIAVLAYLAETHGIWGPFLVVSPASTLHNWQQEIAKFVPDFKVLPYWGTGKDRKVLRKFWDRKNPTYAKDAPFHVMVTSYQMVVADAQYFQRMKWQYMILDEAQAIKSSSSSRWKSLLSFQCRNRLLLTGTPIQNNMQELWALLHFIMPSLFDSHDEFSDWFAKDIESHATSGAQLNEQQLRRLHVILKPFMLRRIKKNVQSELGDKIEIDVYCGMTNRQKKLYHMLKSQISVRDLIERARGEDGAQSLMNLVMQFRKVCNHPDLFERADTSSPFSFATFASTASFVREAALPQLDVQYTAVNQIAYRVPKVVYREMLLPHWNNTIGLKQKVLEMMSVYREENMAKETRGWLGLVDCTTQEFTQLAKQDELARSIRGNRITHSQIEDGLIEELYGYASPHKRLLITHESGGKSSLTAGQKVIQEVNLVDGLSTDSDSDLSSVSNLSSLFNVQSNTYTAMHLNTLDPAAISPASAPPVDIICSDASFAPQRDDTLFNRELRLALMPMPLSMELGLMEQKVPLLDYPPANMLPQPLNAKTGHASIQMPSMERFITESGKLSKLDELLVDLKANDHRVLLYFQMTKMMDLMEEYLTYKLYKYIRLDGSSKLGDRRDLVHDWQTKPEIFIFILSTRAGGLGINLTAADTVIFYDSDWNPTIDSQAMDRAHRLGQTRQVTVYRLLVKGTIEERMRDRAKQKEHVQQVVMEGKAAPAPSAKDDKREVAMWLLDNDEDADEVLGASEPSNKRIREISGKARNSKLEDMYHEGEGEFDDGSSAAPSRMDSPRN